MVQLMSVKEHLAAAIEALPEGLSFEQAMTRIRQLYKVNQGLRARKTAKDVFDSVGAWEGESSGELSAVLLAARREGGSKEPPEW